MQIIISPTKTMTTTRDHDFQESQPTFLAETARLLEELKKLSLEEATALWKCSEALGQKNYERLLQMDLTKQTTPAILSYQGLQYQYMAPHLFTAPAFDYIQEHLRILSGFYGLLRPFDGIVPYRLEMQAPLRIGAAQNLYTFWGSRLYEALDFANGPIINLASNEYTKVLTPYLQKDDQLLDISFVSLVNGKPKVKATLAKMARGEMIRFMAEHQVVSIEDIQAFDHPDYRFSEAFSTEQKLVFVYQETKNT